MDNARRWVGFVCPDCRFVFRVPREHDGVGLVCPSCRRMLRIPPPEFSPPLVVPIQSKEREPEPAGSVDGSGQRRKSRRKRVKSSESHAWERKSSGASVSARQEKRQMIWLLATGGVVFMLATGAVWFAMSGGSATGPKSASHPATDDKAAGKPLPLDPPKQNEAAFLQQAESLARKFLETRTAKDLIPLVCDSAVTGPKILAYYDNGPVDAPGLAEFQADALVRQGEFIQVPVRTRQFENREIWFRAAPGEALRIDWESWVGWSEMTWQDFTREKPATPKLFRVTLSDVDYYNFGFSDESKFKSFRLESPDHADPLYGYVERDSGLASKLRPSSDQPKIRVALMLSFPEKASHDNQVIIHRLVADGWLVDGSKAP